MYVYHLWIRSNPPPSPSGHNPTHVAHVALLIPAPISHHLFPSPYLPAPTQPTISQPPIFQPLSPIPYLPSPYIPAPISQPPISQPPISQPHISQPLSPSPYLPSPISHSLSPSHYLPAACFLLVLFCRSPSILAAPALFYPIPFYPGFFSAPALICPRFIDPIMSRTSFVQAY